MHTRDSERFDWLPPLLVPEVAKLASGSTLNLALLHFVETGADKPVGAIYQVTYTHRELIFRSPGHKDAVAFGEAKMEGDADSKEVTILFSRLLQSASLVGLTLQGKVKPIGKNPELD